MSKMTNMDNVGKSAFVRKILQASMDVVFELNPDKIPSPYKDEKHELEPDERQFYIENVGMKLANLLIAYKQLCFIPYYLTSFHRDRKMIDAGITKNMYLIYTIENYYIRINSLYDRVLQLINSVFHLCVDVHEVTHSVIVSNLKVRRTKIPQLLKRIRRTVKEYRDERHMIVHVAGFETRELTELNMYTLVAEQGILGSPILSRDLPRMRNTLTRNIVVEQKKRFVECNKKITAVILLIFDELNKVYDAEKIKISAGTIALTHARSNSREDKP